MLRVSARRRDAPEASGEPRVAGEQVERQENGRNHLALRERHFALVQHARLEHVCTICFSNQVARLVSQPKPPEEVHRHRRSAVRAATWLRRRTARSTGVPSPTMSSSSRATSSTRCVVQHRFSCPLSTLLVLSCIVYCRNTVHVLVTCKRVQLLYCNEYVQVYVQQYTVLYTASAITMLNARRGPCTASSGVRSWTTCS